MYTAITTLLLPSTVIIPEPEGCGNHFTGKWCEKTVNVISRRHLLLGEFEGKVDDAVPAYPWGGCVGSFLLH